MIAGTSSEAKAQPQPKMDGGGSRVNTTELMIAGLLALFLLILHWFYAHSQPWNSDEPQHLHVVWSWATGRLPYRDVFDNHSPLFQFLCSPLLYWFGERPDIMVPMRLAMTPLFALSLWCIYRVGSVVYSQRAGLWAAMFTSLYPFFFFKMSEFRTDVLWTTLWLVTLVVLTGGPLTRRRIFWAGVALGATFSVSMKTTLLLIVLLAAGGITWLAKRFIAKERPEPRPFHEVALDWGAAIGGLLILPSIIIGFFAWKGALGALYYCVIQHNTPPGGQSTWRIFRRLFFSSNTGIIAGVLLLGATALPGIARGSIRSARSLFLLLATGFFYPFLHGIWHMITPQDSVPWYPLVILCMTPAVLWLIDRGGRWLPRPAVLVSLLVVEIVWVFNQHSPTEQNQNHHVDEIAQALRLTRPDEFLMDAKGEMIFRPRPYYYVLETLTRKRLADGLLPDDLPQCLIETRTAVVRPSDRMTPGSVRFVDANYISIGKLSVLGKQLTMADDGHGSFQITIPGDYALIDAEGAVTANLDGSPLVGHRWLGPGVHEFTLASPQRKIALVWARAVDLGFSPFHTPPELLHN